MLPLLWSYVGGAVAFDVEIVVVCMVVLEDFCELHGGEFSEVDACVVFPGTCGNDS